MWFANWNACESERAEAIEGEGADSAGLQRRGILNEPMYSLMIDQLSWKKLIVCSASCLPRTIWRVEICIRLVSDVESRLRDLAALSASHVYGSGGVVDHISSGAGPLGLRERLL